MRDKAIVPHGRASLWCIEPTGWRRIATTPNLTMVDWGFIAAKCLGHGDSDYRLRGMYIEFQNVAAPGDAVTPPDFVATEGISYYNGLSGSPDTDFIRAATVGQPEIRIETGYESSFTDGVDGNLLVLFSQTLGSTGVHGQTFSDGANSKVFGAALVAAPVWADRTRDKIFARAYFDVSDQLIKPAAGQVGISWEIPFVP